MLLSRCRYYRLDRRCRVICPRNARSRQRCRMSHCAIYYRAKDFDVFFSWGPSGPSRTTTVARQRPAPSDTDYDRATTASSLRSPNQRATLSRHSRAPSLAALRPSTDSCYAFQLARDLAFRSSHQAVARLVVRSALSTRSFMIPCTYVRTYVRVYERVYGRTYVYTSVDLS